MVVGVNINERLQTSPFFPEGFHDDWQLVVELIYEMDVKYMNQVDGGGNIVGGDEWKFVLIPPIQRIFQLASNEG